MRKLCCLLMLAGCSGPTGSDAGPPHDGGARPDGSLTDAGAAALDAGSLDTDAGVRDAGALDAGPPLSTEFACNSSVGATRPLAVCTMADPCTELLVTVREDVVTAETEPAVCHTTNADRTSFDDGAALETVVGGLARQRCEYLVPGASAASLRPLVIFLHGAGGDASNVYNGTSLRDKAVSFELSGDSARAGFHLVSVQGRNLHWPTAGPRDGSHHDIYHRDLNSPSRNQDIAYLDALIDSLVDGGAVDPARIYLTGWSNGGFFAQMYGIARHEVATPGGNRVAAVAVYSAADPFHEAVAGESPSCRLSTYPTSDVPIFIIGRACDLIACDAAQAADLRGSGVDVAPGAVVGTWVDDLGSRVGDSNVERRIINASGRVVTRCARAAFCGGGGATVNHTRWPDGVADGGGRDHEADMLAFLARHPLP